MSQRAHQSAASNASCKNGLVRTLVVGCNGMLGTDLMAALRNSSDFEPVGVDVPDIDITRPHSVNHVTHRIRPLVIINCAAYTDVDGCESNRDLAFAVNGEGPGILARAARNLGALLVHISTDFVFDGTKLLPYVEEDLPHPISAYGESKLLGERLVMEQTDEFAIFRTAWLYGRHGNNFVDTMLKLGSQRNTLRVVADQIGSPTCTVHLAEGLIIALRKGLRGLFHLTNSGCCSRYEWAKKTFELAAMAVEVLPATTDEFPHPARRPANSALDCSKFTLHSNYEMPAWDTALAEYISER